MSTVIHVVTEEIDYTPSTTLLATSSVDEAFQAAIAGAKSGGADGYSISVWQDGKQLRTIHFQVVGVFRVNPTMTVWQGDRELGSLRFGANTPAEEFVEFAAIMQAPTSDDAPPVRRDPYGLRIDSSTQEFRAELGAGPILPPLRTGPLTPGLRHIISTEGNH